MLWLIRCIGALCGMVVSLERSLRMTTARAWLMRFTGILFMIVGVQLPMMHVEALSSFRRRRFSFMLQVNREHSRAKMYWPSKHELKNTLPT